jgi:hypothetical protein
MDPATLQALLDAYVAGDVVVRKIIVDWLEENDHSPEFGERGA